MDADAYCREIESYLCRKNEGHLVRLVGPAFEVVSRWAADGVPFKVACRGIDRYVERYYAKGPRRRPVRIEFCEADVLDAFDEWRRAVGVGTAGMPAAETPGPGPQAPGDPSGVQRPGHSLRAHVDRVVTRLTDLLAGGRLPAGLEQAVSEVLEELAKGRDASRLLRGEARQHYIAGLDELDGRLVDAARAAVTGEELQALRREASADLAGFQGRMAPDAYERALEAASARLLRERMKLPTVSYRAA